MMGAMSEEHAGRFRSHKTYVEAFAWLGGRQLMTSEATALQRLASHLHGSGAVVDKQPTSIDYEQVRKCLRNAWSTEVLLGLPGEWAADEDEFIRLSNTWGVVQAYYVGYHVTQALIVAKGQSRPTSHPKTQQLYASLWVDRAIANPPWSLGIGHAGWKNLPSGVNIDHGIHSWSACNGETCWSLAAKALKSTRDDAVRAQIKSMRDEGQRKRRTEWDADEQRRLAQGRRPRSRPASFPRPQLTPRQKDACDQKVRTFTLLDYLYRLRVGANYDDSAVFTDGPENNVDSYLLHRRLAYLASGMAFTSELRIRHLVGSTRFDRWADTFIAGNIPSGYSIGVKARRGHY